MIRPWLLFLACGAALGASAPGLAQPAPESAMTTLRQADARVAAIAYRLASAGRPLCPAPYPLTGLLFHHLGDYLPGDRRGMIARYGLDRGPGVLTVLAASPAADAGLRAGDVLLAVNGRGFPPVAVELAERDPDKRRRIAEAGEHQLEDALRLGPARLTLLRDGHEILATLSSRPGCFGRVHLARNPTVNAFSNGEDVVVTTAMLDFVRSDDELALIIGHEMAHFILRHPPMHSSDKLLASIGIGSAVFWKREEAADRLALRLMAAAGYDLDAAIPFWRRFLGKYDRDPQIFRYHPSLGARERIVREEIAAIRATVQAPR